MCDCMCDVFSLVSQTYASKFVDGWPFLLFTWRTLLYISFPCLRKSRGFMPQIVLKARVKEELLVKLNYRDNSEMVTFFFLSKTADAFSKRFLTIYCLSVSLVKALKCNENEKVRSERFLKCCPMINYFLNFYEYSSRPCLCFWCGILSGSWL